MFVFRTLERLEEKRKQKILKLNLEQKKMASNLLIYFFNQLNRMQENLLIFFFAYDSEDSKKK